MKEALEIYPAQAQLLLESKALGIFCIESVSNGQTEEIQEIKEILINTSQKRFLNEALKP